MKLLKTIWSYLCWCVKPKPPKEYEHPSQRKVAEILKEYELKNRL